MTIPFVDLVKSVKARLFPAAGPDIGLELVDLRSTPKGLTIQTYRTTGRPQYES